MGVRRGLGAFALAVGVLLFLGVVAGLGRALSGEDTAAFFVMPFLLTAALVFLGVGVYLLRGHRAEAGREAGGPPAPRSTDGRPPPR